MIVYYNKLGGAGENMLGKGSEVLLSDLDLVLDFELLLGLFTPELEQSDQERA